MVCFDTSDSHSTAPYDYNPLRFDAVWFGLTEEKPAASIFKADFYAADRCNKRCHILETVT
jgi:hypothetical protein